MPIIKFCSEKYVPTCADSTIQLCSLRYYRSVDNDFIRDVDEGVMGKTLALPTPIATTGSELGSLFGKKIVGNGSVRMAGRVVRITRPIPNAYIFCTSDLESPSKSHAAGFGYDSWYTINYVDDFAKILGQGVAALLGCNVQIAFFHGRVIYQDDKNVDYSTLPGFANAQQSVRLAHYFLKRRRSKEDPEKIYEEEREYRFVFLPIDKDHRTVELKQEKIYVPAGALLYTLSAGG